VVSNFIMQALRNEPITIYGDGTQTRSFCYVSDLIDGIWRLMNTEDLTTPVNIGNPAEFTIRELAEIVLSNDRFTISNRLPPNSTGRPRSAAA
jgi:UDP-glucuronate decarboxylase